MSNNSRVQQARDYGLEYAPTQGSDVFLSPSQASKTAGSVRVPAGQRESPSLRPLVAAVTRRGKQRKAAGRNTPSNEQSLHNDSVEAWAVRISKERTVEEMQQVIYELHEEGSRANLPTGQVLNNSTISREIEPLHLFQAIPAVALRIEESAASEKLSRIRNRLALAEFYRAYREAQEQPVIFLDVVSQILPAPISPAAPSNRTKRSEVKNRFVDLVFNDSNGTRNRKKDSTRVNDWQRLGRPWYDMISRYGNRILLLVPRELTNDRQSSRDAFTR